MKRHRTVVTVKSSPVLLIIIVDSLTEKFICLIRWRFIYSTALICSDLDSGFNQIDGIKQNSQYEIEEVEEDRELDNNRPI